MQVQRQGCQEALRAPGSSMLGVWVLCVVAAPDSRVQMLRKALREEWQG